jgi:hypothetical protein
MKNYQKCNTTNATRLKKMLSLFIAFVMVLGLLPATALPVFARTVTPAPTAPGWQLVWDIDYSRLHADGVEVSGGNNRALGNNTAGAVYRPGVRFSNSAMVSPGALSFDAGSNTILWTVTMGDDWCGLNILHSGANNATNAGDVFVPVLGGEYRVEFDVSVDQGTVAGVSVRANGTGNNNILAPLFTITTTPETITREWTVTGDVHGVGVAIHHDNTATNGSVISITNLRIYQNIPGVTTSTPWTPNLVGATSTGAARNPVSNGGNALGIITSSGADGCISVTAGGALHFRNMHANNNLRLQIIAAGSNANSAVGHGFTPILGNRYLLTVDAATTDGGSTPPAALRFRPGAAGGVSETGDVTAAAGTTTFTHEFTYDGTVSDNGTVVVAIDSRLAGNNADGPIFFSNISIQDVTTQIASVGVAPATLELEAGGATGALTATTAPATANRAVTWSSSNTAVATVSATGVVTPVSAGTATIRATSVQNGTVSGTANVTVTAPAAPGYEVVLYDMQTDPNLTSANFNGGGNLTADQLALLPFVGLRQTGTGINFAVTGAPGSRVITISGRGGRNHGMQIGTSTIDPPPGNHEIRFEVAGTLGAEAGHGARIINGTVSGSTDVVNTLTGAGGAFELAGTVPAGSMLAAYTIGSGSTDNTGTGNSSTFVINVLRVILICHEVDCCGDTGTPFTWGEPTGQPLHLAATTESRGDEVSYIHGAHNSGNDTPAVLRIENVVSTDTERQLLRDARSDGMVPRLTLSSPTAGNRAVWIWTDLSQHVQGVTGNPAQLAFLTNANVTAGGIIRVSGDNLNPVNAMLPIELLYTPASGGQPERFAQYIYVLGTVNDHGGNSALAGMLTPGGLRQDITNGIIRAVIQIVEPPQFATNISLNWGVNEREMRFTWWTPMGATTNARLQIVPANLVVNGEMPASTPIISGVQDRTLANSAFSASHPFDVNRAIAPNLLPGTRYAYRVGDGTAANWSRIHYFYTHNPSVTGRQTVILAGDPQLGGSPEGLDSQTWIWNDGLRRAIARAEGMPGAHGGVDFILSTGDNSSPAANLARFNAYLSPAPLRSIPVFTTIGNHDTNTGSGSGAETLALLSLGYHWPNHTWIGGSSPTYGGSNYLRGGGNHFFVYGDVLYISLNTNLNDRAVHRATLQAATTTHPDTTWRIVTFHQDIFGNGTGHAAGMPGSNRQRLLYELEAFDIDLVINGHEHTFSRSLFMDGRNEDPAAQHRSFELNQYPANFAGNRTGRLIYEAHPGAYIAPVGIPFITTGSIADFPKYTSITPMTRWTAWTDPAQYDNYQQYSILVIDGDSLTIETYVVPYNTDRWRPSGAAEILTNSFTMRQTARHEDLVSLRTGAAALPQGDVTSASWTAFQDAITAANGVGAGAGSTAIHNAYMALYEAYYALENTASFTALNALVQEAAAVLEDASEGLWAGQFPAGSIAPFREIFDAAALVNSVRLSTQASIDAQYALLRPAFTVFMASRSNVPRPWIEVHDIPATGTYTMNLLHWMDETILMNSNWEGHDNVTPRYFAHFTKVNFGGGSLVANYTTLANVPAFGDVLRNDVQHGPMNAHGGRGPATMPGAGGGHITRTHIGEWIRYELDVAQAGEYSVQLGAINRRNVEMEVRLRDLNGNTLTSFLVPASHGTPGQWETAPLVDAENTIYLPRGEFIIEMLFMHDGVGSTRPGASGTPNVYLDGPDVDIITFTRVGNMTPPTFTRPANHFVLPLPPNDAAGNSLRQRGWATDGVTNEWTGTGNPITGAVLTREIVSLTTHIVLEVAGRPPGNIDAVIGGGHAGDWNQTTLSIGTVYNDATREIVIPISSLTTNAANVLWSDISDGMPRRLIVSHNTDSWDDMNVIGAYLILAICCEDSPNCDCDCGGCDLAGCAECNPPCGGGGAIFEDFFPIPITQAIVDRLIAGDEVAGHLSLPGIRATPRNTAVVAFNNGGLQVVSRSNSWQAVDVVLEGIPLVDGVDYRLVVTGQTTGTESFLSHYPLNNAGGGNVWEYGNVTGTATGISYDFDNVIPVDRGASQGTDHFECGPHRIRVRTTGTGGYTISSIMIQRDSGRIGAGCGKCTDCLNVCATCNDFPCRCNQNNNNNNNNNQNIGGGGGGGFIGGGLGLRPPVTGEQPAVNDREVTIPEGQDSVTVTSSSLQQLANGGGSLIVSNEYGTVTIPPAALQSIIAQSGANVEIGLVMTESETSIASVEFTVTSGDTAIRNLAAPVTITVAIEIDEGINHHRIVATLEDGTIVGGRYDTETGLFTFETAITGSFEISYVENLNRLVLQIGGLFIIDLADNGGNQNMDVPPVIVDGRTLMPVRFMAYALGADVGWNEATREVSLTLNGQTLTFPVDGTITPALAALGMDVPPMIIDGRTMVPLRFISEFFGAVVTWDDATRTIEVIQ